MRRAATLAILATIFLTGCYSAQDMNDACRDHNGVQTYIKGKHIVICRDGLAVRL
jgi:hypothetical protein